MRILLVEDDVKLGQLMIHYLKKQQMEIDWAKQAQEALEYITLEHDHPYQVVLVDWMIPGMSGVELIQRLRQQHFHRAIILITARDTVDDRVTGLTQGADDYLVKPFAMAELVARIHALSRRNFATFEEQVLTIGELQLNRSRHSVRRAEQEIMLTQREFDLFEFFMRHPGHVFSKEALLQRLWGSQTDVTLNAVEACIKLLRKKLSLVGAAEWIETIRGVGYRYAKTGD